MQSTTHEPHPARELTEELGLLRERVRQLKRTAELALTARMQLPVPANRRAG